MAKPASTLVPKEIKDDLNIYVRQTFFKHAVKIAVLLLTGVSERHDECILEHIVVEVVIGRKSHDSTPTNGERVEGLSGCIFPHLTHTDLL